MRKLCALFSFVLAQQIGSAAYTYYQSYTGSATGFTQNGTLISVSNSRGQGFTASSANGGSLISATAVPDGSFNYEAAMTLGIGHSGVTYTLYVLASPDALAGSQTATGTYYSVALTPTIASNGTCSGSLVINERNHGSVFMVGSKVIPCRDGMTLHAVTAPNGQLNIYGDAPTLTPMFLGNFYITSGGSMTGDGTTQNPLGLAAFGISGAPSGSSTDYIVNLRVGPLDQTAPNAIVNVNAYPLANQVTLHAPGTTDTNGVGVGMYYLWRNGAFLQESPTPDFADTSVQPGTQYQYMIAASNFHSKFSQGETISVTTLAAGAMDPREVGLRPTGTYWGGSGEQIDVLSGNLNYSYPLITAQGRGWSVPIGLSYNSQNWVQDASGTNWHFGNDSGMGYGWNLQVGALRKYTLGDGWTASYYEFRDSTDAVYRLDQNANGIWSSTQSLYVWYDSNANKLHFANGTFWSFGCMSSLGEQDAGDFYPTTIEDSNGNIVTISYDMGLGTPWYNSSGRILYVSDPRGTVYSFTYKGIGGTSVVRYLSQIKNNLSTGQTMTFAYSQPTQVVSPIGSGTAAETTVFLNSVTDTATGLITSFTYDPSGSGELTQVTYPYGGHIRWVYGNEMYASDRTVREVDARYLLWDTSIGERESVRNPGVRRP